MWDAIKFILPLVLTSAAIVTIDQYVKKTRHWKLWAGATILACFIFAVLVVVGPPEVTMPSLGENSGSQHASSPAKTSPGETGGKTGEAKKDDSDAATKGTEQTQVNEQAQNTQQNGLDGQTAGQTTGQQNEQLKATDQSGSTRQTTVFGQSLLLPVDEAALVPVFNKFRDDFLKAVNRKDLSFLKKHLSPDIRYSFGDNNGLDGFLKKWQLNANPDKSPIWSELEQLLALGGTFDKKRTVFTVPYVFSNFPPTIDSFENVAVIRQNVSIHAAPNPNSPVIMGVSYKILKLADTKSYKSTGSTEPGEAATWRKVKTTAGDGFINEAYIRSPIDYRAQFRQENGEWKMILFVAGD